MRKWFCENIGYLEIGTNTGQFDVSTEALVTHKVVKFSNMLRSLVVHRILRNLDVTKELPVTVNGWRLQSGHRAKSPEWLI